MAAHLDREAIVRPGDEEFWREFRGSSAHRVGRTFHVSGETGMTPEGALSADPIEQMRTAFQNLSLTLRTAGVTWGDVVTMTTYHVGLQDQIQAFVEVHNEFVREPYPAWTAVGVTELLDGAIVEISLIAQLPEDD